jgi:trigger factor
VAVKTTITELPDSRVRLEAEVPSEELESSVQKTATQLGRELRIPGFRKGKVPPAMVIQRVGREAVLEQAVRESLPQWYEQALMQADLNTVGDPELHLHELPSPGEPLEFSIEIAVTPKSKLGDYKALEVGKREPEVPAEAIDQEVERLREAFARVESIDRPLAEGDVAVVDFIGRVDGEPFEGGEARDYMLEIGTGRLVEGFEEQLVGASAGDTRTVEIDFPADYRNQELSGKSAEFEVNVKDVKSKELPELNDEWVSEASEFDTLAELRGDIEEKLKAAQASTIEEEFREAVVDAAADQAQIELSDELIAARAEELWNRTERALQRQNIDPETYLKASGRSREEVIEAAKEDAERQLRRESLLEAVAEAEGIEVSDDDLLDVLRTAEGEDAKPEKLLDRLKKSGRDAPLKHDLRLRKAADLLVENARPIDLDTAKAREKIWTPEKVRDAAASQLWTPGDPPPTPSGGDRRP